MSICYDTPTPELLPQAPVCELPPETDLSDLDPMGMQDVYGNQSTMDLLGDEESEVCEESPAEEICEDPAVEICEDPAASSMVEDELLAPPKDVCVEGGDLKQEQIDAAKLSRDGLAGQLAGMKNLTDEQRQAVLGRVQGLEGDALVAEMASIDHALASKNGDRSMIALAQIQDRINKNPDAVKRLTPEVVAMMVSGVADSRTDSDRGQEGILNARQAGLSADALLSMDDDQYAQMLDLLHKAGKDADGNVIKGADPGAEQALLLKAAASRKDKLNNTAMDTVGRALLGGFGWKANSDLAMDDISGFAGSIRGMKRDDLIYKTTALDVDNVNRSTVDPDNLAANNDTKVDNDGLFQRYGDSCVPTSGQLLRAEADPIYALKLHTDGIDSTSLDLDAAKEQKKVLEANGGVAVSRLGDQAQTSASKTMDALQASNQLKGDERTALERSFQNQALTPEDQTKADAALKAVRAQNNGHPTDVEIQAMRNDAGKSGAGMNSAAAAFDTISKPGTQTGYTDTSPKLPKDAGADLDDFEKRLVQGEDVGVGVYWPGGGGHQLVATDVRREADGSRKFLISDPWTGATRWVTDGEFKSGNWTKSVFGFQSKASRYDTTVPDGKSS